MDFSNIARQLNEDAAARDAEISAAEKATSGGQKQIEGTTRRREKQKAQMSQQTGTPMKSDISYTSEEFQDLMKRKEYTKMIESSKSDWRSDLKEGPEDHPYVDVMPSINQKSDEAKKQMAAAAKSKLSSDGAAQAKGGLGLGEQVLNEDEVSEGLGSIWGKHIAKGKKKKKKESPEEREDRLNKKAQSFLAADPKEANKEPYSEGFKEDEIETMRQQHQAREEQKKKLPKYKAAPQSRQSPYGRKKGDPYAPRGGESD